MVLIPVNINGKVSYRHKLSPYENPNPTTPPRPRCKVYNRQDTNRDEGSPEPSLSHRPSKARSRQDLAADRALFGLSKVVSTFAQRWSAVNRALGQIIKASE